MDSGGVQARAARLKPLLERRKQEIAPSDFGWYPYDTFGNIGAMEQLLSGSARDLLALIDGGPAVDIGAADGDLAFFMESLGVPMHVVDYPQTNFNGCRGVRCLKAELGSSVEILETDLPIDLLEQRDARLLRALEAGLAAGGATGADHAPLTSRTLIAERDENPSPPAPSVLTPWICRERVSVSGLYWSEIIRCTAAVSGSTNTMPPFSNRGEPGKLLMDFVLSSCVQGFRGSVLAPSFVTVVVPSVPVMSTT